MAKGLEKFVRGFVININIFVIKWNTFVVKLNTHKLRRYLLGLPVICFFYSTRMACGHSCQLFDYYWNSIRSIVYRTSLSAFKAKFAPRNSCIWKPWFSTYAGRWIPIFQRWCFNGYGCKSECRHGVKCVVHGILKLLITRFLYWQFWDGRWALWRTGSGLIGGWWQ